METGEAQGVEAVPATRALPEAAFQKVLPFSVRTLWRWRAWMGAGILLSWLVILVLVLAAPRELQCEAVIGLPDIVRGTSPEKSGPVLEKLIVEKPTVGTYRLIEASLVDGRTLAKAFETSLAEADIRSLERNLASHVAPQTTGARDELMRLGPDERVSGIRLSYWTAGKAQAEEILQVLVELVRGAVMTRVFLDGLDARKLMAARESAKQRIDMNRLSVENESLGSLEGDLRRIRAAAPGDGIRDLVDLKDSGYFYLTPGAQLVGLLARRADNQHRLRLATRAASAADLKSIYLAQLEQSVREDLTSRGTFRGTDIPSLMARSLRRFQKDSPGPESFEVTLDMEGWHHELIIQQAALRYVQSPTTRTTSRAMRLALMLTAAFVLIPVGVLTLESVRLLARLV